jgi:hypothetical protein
MPLMAESLEQEQTQVVRLFRAALRQKQLAHAYLLQSADLNQAYTLALELAKTLLCDEKPSADGYCGQCRNCKWLSDNAHPDFITLSRLTYPTDEDRKRKAARSQITTDQLQQLGQQLLMKREKARIVVFTDATLLNEEEAMTTGLAPLPYEWRSNEKAEGKTLRWIPLTSTVFNEKTANQFLKTLEEPPAGCLFLFLTNSAANLLATVVSRCQVVPFSSVHVAGGNAVMSSVLTPRLEGWWQALRQGEPLLQLLEKLPIKLTASSPSEALEPVALMLSIQRWLQAEPLRAGTLVSYAAAIRLLRQAEQQLAAHVQPAAVWLTLNAGLQQLYR